MIKNTKTRIQICITKKQAEWLENTCKKAGISKSKYISWMLAKSAEEMLKILNLNTHFGNYTEEEIQEIISYNWIDD